MFLEKLEIRNIDLRIKFFFTKELVTKFVFGAQKKFSSTKTKLRNKMSS